MKTLWNRLHIILKHNTLFESCDICAIVILSLDLECLTLKRFRSILSKKNPKMWDILLTIYHPQQKENTRKSPECRSWQIFVSKNNLMAS